MKTLHCYLQDGKKNASNARQKWKKGPADGEGFFTLENISSEKFLTAVSENSLIIENLR